LQEIISIAFKIEEGKCSKKAKGFRHGETPLPIEIMRLYRQVGQLRVSMHPFSDGLIMTPIS